MSKLKNHRSIGIKSSHKAVVACNKQFIVSWYKTALFNRS